MHKGSFRGLSFRVKSQQTEGGRRIAQHEYPGRDEPWPEDLGRKGRTHTLEMHLIGGDYSPGCIAMCDALEQAGPAELVHPWRGRINIQVETYRLRESTREGGMGTFSVTFLEAGKQQFPVSVRDTASVVATHADTALTATINDFSSSFDVTGPGWIGDAAIAQIGSATDRIDALLQSVPAIPSQISGFSASLTGLHNSLNTLIRTPAVMGNELVILISGIALMLSDPVPALNIYRKLGLFESDAGNVPSTTPARRKQAANQLAVIALVSTSALIEETRSASQITPESSAAALALRDDIAGRLDTAAMTAADKSYAALSDLRAAIMTDLSDRAVRLPEITTYRPLLTQPALVLAYRIHGDARRADEIINRNSIAHPGFVPGGSALEVLNG